MNINTAKNYKYNIRWSEEDGGFVATCEQFPSLSYIDMDAETTFTGIIALVNVTLEDMKQANQTIPKAVVATADVWPPFWYESNQFFTTIDGPDLWERLRMAYPESSDEMLLASREATYRGSRNLEERDARPNYGLRIEHDGDRTLRDFFIEKHIPLPNKEAYALVSQGQ